MHILIIPSWYPASVNDVGGSFFREQAIALAKRGHEVGVIYPQLASLRRPGTWSSKLRSPQVMVDEGVQTYRSLGLNWFPRVPRVSTEIWIRKGMKLFQRYIKENGEPDILHAHSMFHGGLLAERIAEKFDIPFVITEHSTAFARGLVLGWQIRSGARAVKKASATLAVSAELALLLDQCYGTPKSSWTFLPNIVADQFAKAPLVSSRSEKGTQFRFCNIAYLTQKKGVDVLLRAFAKVFEKHPESKLIIGGDGEERASLELLSRELGLTGKVEFLGHLSREQVLGVMSNSDAFVLASHHETFGVVLIEALALGKPVVATRCGGPESIVQSGDGVLVESGSVKELAEGMLQLQRNASQYEPVAIREACLARFSEDAVVKRLLLVYEDVLANKISADV